MAILENPDYKARIELVIGPDFPSLKQYKDVVQFYGFDQPCAKQNECRIDGVHEKLYANEARSEVLVRLDLSHVPSKQLVYEHNFDMFVTKEVLDEFPFMMKMMKMMMKSCNFGSVAKGPMPKGPTALGECRIHCGQMATILDLDVRAAGDYHSHVSCQGHGRARQNFMKIFTRC